MINVPIMTDLLAMIPSPPDSTTAGQIAAQCGVHGVQRHNEGFFKKLHEKLSMLEQDGMVKATHPRFPPRRYSRIK